MDERMQRGWNEIQDLVEEEYGFNIEWININWGDQEQWFSYWFSDQTIDISFSNWAWCKELSRQGLLKELDWDMLKQHMPNWIQAAEDMYGPYDTMKSTLLTDGRLYLVPLAWYEYFTNIPFYVRTDWLDQVGMRDLSWPIISLDDYLDMMHAMKDAGLAKYGHSPHQVGAGISPIFGAFGTQNGGYTLRNGAVDYKPVSPEYREAMTVIAQMFADGLIDPECQTDQRTQVREKISAQEIGVFWEHPGWMLPTQQNADAPHNRIREAGYETDFIAFTIRGPRGDYGGWGGPPSPDGGPPPYIFGHDVDDAKLVRLLEFWESVYNDVDKTLRYYYGEETIGWNWVNGGVLRTDEQLALDPDGPWPVGMKGLGNTFAMVPLPNAEKDPKCPESNVPYWMAAAACGGVPHWNFKITEDSQVELEKGPDIYSRADIWFYDFMTGRKSVETDWDAYVAELNGLGLQQICDDLYRLRVE